MTNNMKSKCFHTIVEVNNPVLRDYGKKKIIALKTLGNARADNCWMDMKTS